MTYTFSEEDAASQQGEWVRIAYEEYCKSFRNLTSPDSDQRRPIGFEQWVVEALRHQEYESWRAYFAKMERQWGESLAEQSLGRWPSEVAKEAVEWEDAVARRPSYARSYRDLDIVALSHETWRRHLSPAHFILHPELPRPPGLLEVRDDTEDYEDDDSTGEPVHDDR